MYDATGKRVSKKVTTISTGATTETRYIYDASGNVLATHTISSAEDSVAIDYSLYGSNRLGQYSGSKYKTADAAAAPVPTSVYRYVPGRYRYELSNHLGNVHAVVTGLKTGRDTNGDGKADYYQANVMSLTDYYPFGMEMPGRSYVNGKEYRYGFNGMEKEGDVEPGGYDYGARIYDSRIGKFFSLDPLSKDYPELSNYSFVGNSPIQFIDKEGMKIWIYGADNKPVQFKNGNLLNQDGSPYKGDDPFVLKAQAALIKLKNSDEVVNEKITYLENSKLSHQIKKGAYNVSSGYPNVGSGSIIKWNPEDNDSEGEERPNEIGLAHELSHAYDYDTGTKDFENVIKDDQGNPIYLDKEKKMPLIQSEINAVKFENRVRKSWDVKKRTTYTGVNIPDHLLNDEDNGGKPKDIEIQK